MADAEEKKPLEEKPEAKEDGYVYARDHDKDARVIAREEATRARKAKEEEVKADDSNDTKSPPVGGEESKAPAETEPQKPAPEPDKEDRAVHNQRLVEDAADKAAEKATERMKKELEAIEESKASTKQKEAQVEEVKAKWAKEGRTPSSYDEIYEEARSHALEDAKRWFTEQEQAKTKAAEEQTAAEKAAQELRAKQEDEYRASVEKMTMDEVEELRQEGVLPRPQDPNDPNDPAVKEQMALFQKGLEINTDRMGKGLPPIISISRIYYNHFKPSAQTKSAQPAGADAPIAGNTTARPDSARDQGYVYTRDHDKGWHQLIREVTGKK